METDFATQLRELGFRIEDIVESFTRSGGPGGQNVNKVSTAVTLRHLPTGLQVVAQDHSSQLMNRRVARERMIALITEKRKSIKLELKQEREKKQRGAVKKTRGRVRE